MSEAKHKCRRSFGVLKETRNKYFRISNITIMQKTMWCFGTMHITLRMTIMLSIVGALYKKRMTQQKSKIDRPFTEESIDLHSARASALK